MKMLKNVSVLSVLLSAAVITSCASDESETSAEMKEAVATAQDDYTPTDEMTVETEEEAIQETEPEMSSKTMYVTARSLNVRSGPGTDNDKVKSAPFGEQVEVSQVSDGWAQIGDDEYVSAKYLSASKQAPRPTVSATVDTLGEAIVSEDEDGSADEGKE